MEAKKLGTTHCPKCGPVTISDPNKFIVIYPRGDKIPQAEVTCENCGLIYKVTVSWANAVAFDKAGCSVVGFSFGRGKEVEEKDVLEVEKLSTKEFNERLKDFFNVPSEES